MTVPDEISRSKYVSLTTYRKDGTAVATPVWQVSNGGELLIVTDAGAGKVKRIRNNGEVEITPCGIRGGIASGAASTRGRARLLDEAETTAARRLMARRYTSMRIADWCTAILRIKRSEVVGIAVTF